MSSHRTSAGAASILGGLVAAAVLALWPQAAWAGHSGHRTQHLGTKIFPANRHAAAKTPIRAPAGQTHRARQGPGHGNQNRSVTDGARPSGNQPATNQH